MFHLAEDIDSVTLETRAESAQVGSGYEVVDAVATKIALDQERRITREPGDSVAETTNKKKFSPTRLDLVPTSTALVLASQPVSAVDELATLVASIATEYNSLDSEINDLTDDLLVEERKLAVRYRDELLPRIGQMQMLLSQRGALRELVANDRSLLGALAQLEDIPTWTEWYEAFASRFQGAKSLRTIQRQLKKLRGGTGPMAGADTSLAGDDSDGGADERTSHSGLYRDAEGKSIMSDAMRITRAVSLVKDLQRALEEGFLFEATPAPPSKAPLLEGEVVSDQVRGAYAKLRSVFNRMADTADIENALQLALEEFVQPMMAEHPYLQVETPYRPELQISVTLKRAGRARISAGDWVDYRGGDDRLTKQIGAEASLGRVVDADAFSRPRITWFNGTKWVKPYALFDEEAVHVLFADQAASAYPEAFSTYSEPTLSKPPAAVPTTEADASASSAPSAVAALAASAVAHGVEDARKNPVLSDAVSPSPAEILAEDNLPEHSAGPVTLGFLPHGEATWKQLVPGKKYQVRPAPSGGYGIYEPRSNVLLQLFTEEDDARDAIDLVTEIAVGA